jgi:hypothetical protein
MKLKKTSAKIIFNFIYNQKTVFNFTEFLLCLFRPFLPSSPHFNLTSTRKDRREMPYMPLYKISKTVGKSDWQNKYAILYFYIPTDSYRYIA